MKVSLCGPHSLEMSTLLPKAIEPVEPPPSTGPFLAMYVYLSHQVGSCVEPPLCARPRGGANVSAQTSSMKSRSAKQMARKMDMAFSLFRVNALDSGESDGRLWPNQTSNRPRFSVVFGARTRSGRRAGGGASKAIERKLRSC